MKKAVIPLLAATIVVLAGCTSPLGQTLSGAKQRFADEGRQAAADLVNDAEWVICRGSSVGSVIDRYGLSQEKWEAWMKICLHRYQVQNTPALGS